MIRLRIKATTDFKVNKIWIALLKLNEQASNEVNVTDKTTDNTNFSRKMWFCRYCKTICGILLFLPINTKI